MQALKTLPILRPSRPSSPAPPSTQVTHSTVNGTTQQPPNAANGELKARSRSLSRQLTDKVVTMHLNTGVLPVSANGNGAISPDGIVKKPPSPPSSRPATPRTTASPLPSDPAASTPGAAYMDILGLRLNEAVNKASAGVDFKTKKGFKKGNGWAVGESVVHELPYPPNDAYLMRAVLRTAVRSLSIYITRLESLLLPALTDPSFVSTLNLASPSPTAHPLNSAQHYAVSIAHAAWETCEVLEQTLETGKWPKFVSEALRPVMEKLDLVVGKVTQPLLLSLKRDLIASLSRTEGTSPSGGKIMSVPNPAISGPEVPVKKEPSNQPVSRLTKEVSQPGHARALAIPVALQHFAARIDASRKVLEIVAGPCADDGEGWITNVVVAVIWKGMCVMAEKELAPFPAAGRPPSPASVSKALQGLNKESSVPAVAADKTEKAAVPSLVKLPNPLSILPSRSASRPPSPPRRPPVDPETHGLMSLEGLVKRLVCGLVPPPMPLAAGSVVDPNATDHLAREALHEALEALTSFRIVSASLHGPNASSRTLASIKRIRDDVDYPAEEALDDAWEDLPAIAVYALLARQANAAIAVVPIISMPPAETDEKPSSVAPFPRLRSAAEVWKWSKAEYDRQVLSGFGAAEEWGRRVAQAYKPEVERVLSDLAKFSATSIHAGEKPGRELSEAVEWVKALGVALEARGAIKMAL